MPTGRARCSNRSKRPPEQIRRTSQGDARIFAIGRGMNTSPSTCSADQSDGDHGEHRLTQVAATAASTSTHCTTRRDRHRLSPLRCEKRCPPPVSAGLTALATNARPTMAHASPLLAGVHHACSGRYARYAVEECVPVCLLEPLTVPASGRQRVWQHVGRPTQASGQCLEGNRPALGPSWEFPHLRGSLGAAREGGRKF